ncbi:hypothetical protein GFL54_31080 [Rhizobium laguerreae]|uniref:hypothetical protein n=1 Tax=Rhizobium laguerreae TaxID=1076926 RepID=UPI00143F1691|nr:hypothetical protein [Rhizobium laguerreae]NKM88621.1 hypothetical protein [Rhizobium laguerreae]
MNREEFENLKNRFGPDTATWPAPFRQEASQFLTGDRVVSLSDDETLDHLVLEAAKTSIDESVLVRHVMTRVAKSRRRVGPTIDPRWQSVPATAASMAFVVALSAASGYWVAGTQTDISDDALLAFAAGLPPSEVAETSIFPQEEGSRP